VCTRLSVVKPARLQQWSAVNLHRPRQPSQRSPGCTGLSGAPSDCSVCPVINGRQRSTSPGKETNLWLCSVRCAPDSPVHPRTDDNQCLPKWRSNDSLVPWGYKGSPRRMELLPRHPLSTLQLWIFVTTLLTCKRDIWACSWTVTLSFCFVHYLFSLVCVLLLWCALVCVSTPILTPILIVIICVRRERLQFM
jgi:hypothetical protein